jgi:hypothetical protein
MANIRQREPLEAVWLQRDAESCGDALREVRVIMVVRLQRKVPRWGTPGDLRKYVKRKRLQVRTCGSV